TVACLAIINSALPAASSNDTSNVAARTYHENLVVPNPMAIAGAGAAQTTGDATGLSNGFDIDGHHHPGLSHVVITGFTVKNANFQGILITDSSYVTIWDNHVIGNDRSLNLGPPPTCPGLPPYFAAGEGFDCGEGSPETRRR